MASLEVNRQPSATPVASWRLRAYRVAARLWPRALRDEHLDEALDSLECLLDDERRHSRAGAWVLWMRAMSDSVRTASRERSSVAPSGSAWNDMRGDLRYVWRSWRRRPGFPVTALASLVVGLGLAVAVFTFADGYLFRELPFPSPDQLYLLGDASTITGMVHAADVEEFRSNPEIAPFGFVEWSPGGLSGASLVIGDRRVTFGSYVVSPRFAETLQLPMVAGHWFTKDDYRPSTPAPVWISDHLWSAEFGRDPGVIGRTYRVVDAPRTDRIVVVGVMSPLIASFDLSNEPPDVVTTAIGAVPAGPNSYSSALVRLPAGMTRAQGEAHLNAAYRALPPAPGPRAWSRGSIQLQPLREYLLSGGRPTARVLMAGAVLILLLVGANLTHLLLARGAARASEITLRAALGASRWRTIRLFLVESLALALTGIAGGLLAGRWLSLLIQAHVPPFPTAGRNLALVPMLFDARIITVAIVVGLLLVAGGTLWPAWRAARRSGTWSARAVDGISAGIRSRAARLILGSELAMATVVLSGAVFLGMGIWKYLNQPIGFDYRDRFVVGVELPGTGRGRGTKADLAAIAGNIAAVPGVSSVTTTMRSMSNLGMSVTARDRMLSPEHVWTFEIGAGAVKTWGLFVQRGRALTDEEIASHAPLAVVDERLAIAFWPDADPVGRQITIGDGPARTVIGVIAPVAIRLSGDQNGAVYVPEAKARAARMIVIWAPGLTADQLKQRLAPITASLGSDGYLSVEPMTFSTVFLRDSGEALFQAPIMIVFGALAFIVSGLGLFGLISYLVERRQQEFGIRIALGASRSQIGAFVMRDSVIPAAAGLVVGLIAARALDYYVRSKVFGWDSSGVLTVVIVSALLLGLSVAAAAVPARRAMGSDPLKVLRAE